MRAGASSGRPAGSTILFTTTVARTTEFFVNPVASRLAEEGHRVVLAAGDRRPTAEFKHEAEVLPMNRGMSPGSDLGSLRRWVTYLADVRPDMIVAGTPKASLLALTAGRLIGVPTRVYVLHGAVWDGTTGNRRRLLEAAERASLGASTHHLAVSDSLARLVYARRLCRQMPVVLGSGSFSGVDIGRFQPAHLSARPEPNICFVGRLNRDKGIDVLLRAFDRVRQDVDASLTVVGGVDETAPPTHATLEALRHHPKVNWVGEVADVTAHLQRASILLFPSVREGLGQVLLEAQACGVPVVSWRATGVIDAVRDGFTGVLVGYGDEEALAQGAVRLLTDPQQRGRMSSNARRWVEERFERGAVVETVVHYLDALVAGDDPGGPRHA